MDVSQRIFSDIIIFNKYAKYQPHLRRRENWDEICDRNAQMHMEKYPLLTDAINEVYESFVKPKLVLPSMRSMQFGGRPIQLANNRMFNCSYVAVDHPAAFWEAMFLLLGGSGVGYSVQLQHVAKLPSVVGPTKKTRRFLIGDSIEGWADAVRQLIRAYLEGRSDPIFDYRDIRRKGSQLVTSGGKAPGPDPLRICLDHLRAILNQAVGRKLTSIECHDMMCHIADAVLSGGIRRAALIALFSKTDYDMMSCKTGSWWELNPQRGRANNSVVLKRDEVTFEEFMHIWEIVKMSGCGEPGFFWTNDYDVGANPCMEISIVNMQFCNLTEVVVSYVQSQQQLNAMVRAASFLGTLQAGYTDFHYLRPQWKENTERDALLGVSMTGVGSGQVLQYDLVQAAQEVVKQNQETAQQIGINTAARNTCIKPAGTSSSAVGSSSGVHAWHAEFYKRRMRVGKNEALYHYMIKHFPHLVEDCKFKPHLEAVMTFPQKAPEGSILRSESAMHLLERVKRMNQEWVHGGHVTGANHHNVSCTISIKDEEWDSVGRWMWDNRKYYTGISVLPYDNGSYVQAPFETCTEDEYNQLMKGLHDIDLTEIREEDDFTTLNDQAACAGGACEVNL